MAKATPGSLSESEREILVATEAANLKTLDEDELIALHDRVRRARNKHVQLHRRQVGQQVVATGARGVASVPPRRSASKAELFEGALGRVSAALARSARRAAAELRAARLAAANLSSEAGGSARRAATATKPATARAAKANTRGRRPRPVERKTAAAGKAAGARHQAKRDAR
jgi:hypothetical protein